MVHPSVALQACLDAIYARICTVKVAAYHSLGKPIFWWPRGDWGVPPSSTRPPRDTRTLLVGVYSHVLEEYRKPKLASLKRALVRHHQHVKRNWCLRQRKKRCQCLLQVLDCMLGHTVQKLASPPF